MVEQRTLQGEDAQLFSVFHTELQRTVRRAVKTSAANAATSRPARSAVSGGPGYWRIAMAREVLRSVGVRRRLP